MYIETSGKVLFIVGGDKVVTRSIHKSLLVVALFCTLIFADSKLTLHFFGSSTCGECHELKTELIQPLLEKNSAVLDVKFHDTDLETDMALLLEFEKKFGIKEGSAQEIYFPDTFILGYDDIIKSFEPVLKSRLENKSGWTTANYPSTDSVKSDSKLLKEKVDRFSFWAIVGLGIIDGINPCAIATMIFLISFLAAHKRSRRDILVIGLSYTASVFVTYTIIGVVAFEFLVALKQTAVISVVIKWIAVILAGSVGVISFIDAARFKKTNDTKSITLQLPNSIKKQIHKVINGNLKQKNLILGAIVTGILVTILETFCTGQTYLPAIQAMVKSSTYRLEGIARLLFYNFLFVLPLLIVMIGAYFGLTWNEVAKQTQKNMVALKLLLGTVMVMLALYLGLS